MLKQAAPVGGDKVYIDRLSNKREERCVLNAARQTSVNGGNVVQ